MQQKYNHFMLFLNKLKWFYYLNHLSVVSYAVAVVYDCSPSSLLSVLNIISYNVLANAEP